MEYQRGMKKLLTHVQPEFQISKEALELASGLIDDFNAKMVEETKSNFKAQKAQGTGKKGPRTLTGEHAQNAVKKVMRSDVKTLAIAAGQKAVISHQQGILKFDATQVAADERKVPELEPLDVFIRSLVKLSANDYYGVTLTKGVKSMIGNMLLTLKDILIENAVLLTGDTGVMDYRHMRRAAENFFTENLFSHAHCQSSKLLTRYLEGMLDFAPTPRIRPRPENREVERNESLIAFGRNWQSEHTNTFLKGIKEIASSSKHAGITLQKESVNRINNYVCNIAVRIGVKLVQNAAEGSLTEIHPAHVKRAAQELLPEELSKQTTAHGFKHTLLYLNNLLEFVPKPSARKLAQMKEKKEREKVEHQKMEAQRKLDELHAAKAAQPALPTFKAYSKRLLKELHKSGNMDKEATDLLNDALIDLMKQLSAHAIANPTSGLCGPELGAQQFHNSVRAQFSGQLQHLALESGLKALHKWKKNPVLNAILRKDLSGVVETPQNPHPAGVLDRSSVQPFRPVNGSENQN